MPHFCFDIGSCLMSGLFSDIGLLFWHWTSFLILDFLSEIGCLIRYRTSPFWCWTSSLIWFSDIFLLASFFFGIEFLFWYWTSFLTLGFGSDVRFLFRCHTFSWYGTSFLILDFLSDIGLLSDIEFLFWYWVSLPMWGFFSDVGFLFSHVTCFLLLDSFSDVRLLFWCWPSFLDWTSLLIFDFLRDREMQGWLAFVSLSALHVQTRSLKSVTDCVKGTYFPKGIWKDIYKSIAGDVKLQLQWGLFACLLCTCKLQDWKHCRPDSRPSIAKGIAVFAPDVNFRGLYSDIKNLKTCFASSSSVFQVFQVSKPENRWKPTHIIGFC